MTSFAALSSETSALPGPQIVRSRSRLRGWRLAVALVPLLWVTGCAGQKVRTVDAVIPPPSNMSSYRLALLAGPNDLQEDPEHRDRKMKIYVTLRGIESGPGANNQLLMKREVMDRVGTSSQLTTRFMGAIVQTQRFQVFDAASSGVRDKSSIFLEGQFVATQQRIENLGPAWKPQTTVRLEVRIKDTDSDSLLSSRTVKGTFGLEQGEGTPIFNARDMDPNSPVLSSQLAADFESATQRAMDEVVDYLEEAFRPVGKIREVDGALVDMSGGSNHGFKAGDQVVIFRTSFRQENGKTVNGLIKPMALADCKGVNPDSSTCQITHLVKGAKVQAGDFVAVTDEAHRNLKF